MGVVGGGDVGKGGEEQMLLCDVMCKGCFCVVFMGEVLWLWCEMGQGVVWVGLMWCVCVWRGWGWGGGMTEYLLTDTAATATTLCGAC